METLLRKVDERQKNETFQWVGSNYLCAICHISYLNNPFGYIHHEEQYVTIQSDIILLDYPFANSDPSIPKKIVVATYELKYKKRKNYCYKLYSDDKVMDILIDALVFYQLNMHFIIIKNY